MHSFVKRNPVKGSDRILKEAQGLELLERTLREASIGELSVPARIAVEREQLELECVSSAPPTDRLMRDLGRGLARLHALNGPAYGLEENNYIGLSPQKNGWSDDWGTFFVERRLGFQIERISDSRLRQRFEHALASYRAALIAMLNRHVDAPALVHGDLWSGNVLFDSQRVWLIDPAVYYADPEVDLAMSEMFGGFSPAFYAAYQEVRPLSSIYPFKRRIYNLYHYLNHYNLFGSSYLPGCEEGLAALDETLHC
ncbi:Ribulosamine/erythrulosamine 3-kinase potentially involved in protein deglycation [Marinobacterium lacunae]|uniref:Ribulosamine/erythrulosamine 3-kinase potentially involved in protein deglycation n=1 Tax=Marinobacterium lacunae TaxID=1232683 RepID=A0A081FU83_9GAMM|nr:fructosamine kinase family protein [Marinobacterium lacunae]KEA62088.1 Ribulosamine/erythrulosamine 3-kinase potentially involved in protein deglycation [Marinobacterium lacunae]MBR9885620.1 fructosamine kinase family protein [Oceanospirillales bacterium]